MTLIARLVLMLALAFPLRLAAQLSPGPLARAHATLAGAGNCASCHGVTRREPMTQLCLNCHKEIRWLIDRGRGLHARESRQGKKECASCHPDHAGENFQLIAWDGGSPARFDHNKAGWALEGKHVEEKCEGCHTGGYRVAPSAQLSPRKSSAGWVGLETTCISCHREDDAHNGKLDLKCESCHTAKTWNDAPRFNHDDSDYALTGKHADVECDACHLIKKLAPRTNAEGKLVPVFKPVPHRDCASCHSDPHRGQMTGPCGECHETRGFKIINQREFNHAATRYPLRGKHASVSCEACHGNNLTKKDPPFATCAGCHSDPHQGEGKIAGKPQDCAACHRVEGYVPSTFTVASHQRAAYPLEGKHASVKCAVCHAPVRAAGQTASVVRVGRIRVPFARCTDCHSDSHAGQLATRADKGACEGCHSVSGFAPSSYSVAQHARLRLPLEGRHATVQCAACHGASRPGLPAHPAAPALGSARVAITLAATCTSCHVDAHAGRFESRGAAPQARSCTACHSSAAFHPSTIGIAQHDTLGFKLEGAHRALPCAQCHKALQGEHATSTLLLNVRGVPKLPFAEKRATCANCHETPHGTQFASRADHGECAACHGVDTFAPATRFDHNRSASFPLEGAHAKAECGACHKAARDTRGVLVTTYRGLSPKCESCHGGRVPGRPT